MKIIIFVLLIISSKVTFSSCSYSDGDSFLIDRRVELQMSGGDSTYFEASDKYTIQVQGKDQYWGCAVKVFNNSGKEVSSELFRVTETSLNALNKQNDDDVVRQVIANTQSLATEIESTGEAPCAGCIQLTSSLKPKLKPANIDKRFPIAQLNPSARALNIIKSYEGLALYFYEDGTRRCRNQDASNICSTGSTIYKPTIGYGVQIQDEKEFNDFCKQTLKNSGCVAAKVQWLKVLKRKVKRSANVITKEQALRLLNIEVKAFSDRFKRDYPSVRLKQNEFDALISLYYNATFFFTGNSRRAKAFQAVLKTPGFNLIDLAATMYKDDSNPRQGLFRRRLDEINLLLLNADGPGTSSKPTEIANNVRVRKLYKDMVKYWDSKSSRPFWVSNPSYKPFIKKVRALP